MASITLGDDPQEIHLKISKGADFRKTITVKSGATAEAATPVDYTGATAKMQIRNPQDLTEIFHEMSSANGGIVLGDAAGTITFVIANADSSAFDWEEGEYESLEITHSGGDVEAFSWGYVFTGRELTV